jgi:hypothetical protein
MKYYTGPQTSWEVQEEVEHYLINRGTISLKRKSLFHVVNGDAGPFSLFSCLSSKKLSSSVIY